MKRINLTRKRAQLLWECIRYGQTEMEKSAMNCLDGEEEHWDARLKELDLAVVAFYRQHMKEKNK